MSLLTIFRDKQQLAARNIIHEPRIRLLIRSDHRHPPIIRQHNQTEELIISIHIENLLPLHSQLSPLQVNGQIRKAIEIRRQLVTKLKFHPVLLPINLNKPKLVKVLHKIRL